jgi:hypothetical protein
MLAYTSVSMSRLSTIAWCFGSLSQEISISADEGSGSLTSRCRDHEKGTEMITKSAQVSRLSPP